MTTKRRLRGKDLVQQDIDDIFEDFYRLKSFIAGNLGQDGINYGIIRLVTILEQFCRFVVECGLEKKPDKTPPTIEMDPRMIDSVSESLADSPEEDIQNYVVSLSYSFQNRNDIISMMDMFEMLNKRNDIKKMVEGLEDMFQLRHKAVHTVERVDVDLTQIREYYDGVECLMHKILDALEPVGVSFYYQKMYVMLKSESREKRRQNSEAESHYHTEAIRCRDGALKYLEKRTQGSTHDIDAYSQMMLLYIEDKDCQNIERCIKAMLAIDPDEPLANYCIGLSLKEKNPTGALVYFKKSIEAAPTLSGVYEGLIDILMDHARYAECLPYVDKAIAHLPSEPIFYMLKGRVFEMLNMPECVESCYEIADEMAIEHVKIFQDDVDECEELIEQLQEFGRHETVVKCKLLMDKHWEIPEAG